MSKPTQITETMLTPAQLAEILGTTTRTLDRWRISGDGPVFVRIGMKMIRYPEASTLRWISSRTFAHRAAEAA